MYINKINGRQCKNLLGLSTSLKPYNMSILDYYIQYEDFEIPKCECGKDLMHKIGLTFRKTCGDEICIRNIATKRITSEKTKEKLRKKRFDFLIKKSGKTAWERRSAGEMSYLEMWFDDTCRQNRIYEKYDVVYDLPVFPYFIDFAFLNEKIAVELDGKCHFKNKERLDHDFKKDQKLISEGWRVFRIRFDENNDDKFNELINFIGESKIKNYDEKLYKYREIKKASTNQKKGELSDYNKKLISITLESGIDFSKFGWVKKLSILINKKEQKVSIWMKKYMKDFYEKNCFVRSGKTIERKLSISKIREEYYTEQIKMVEDIKSLKIDFLSNGWIQKVGNYLNIDKQYVTRWMAKYMPNELLSAKTNKDYSKLVQYYKDNPHYLYNSNFLFKKSI